MRFVAIFIVALQVVFSHLGIAQDANSNRQSPAPSLKSPSSGLKSSDWPMDEVELVDGRVFRGLIESQDDRRITLLEIQRPRGKPLGLLIRPLETELVARVNRLPDGPRAELAKRIDHYKRRASIEAGRMASLAVDQVEQAGATLRRYAGESFALESTADDETTRRLIVRLEQVFSAYQRIFPPRRKPSSRLTVKLFGTMAEYREFVGSTGLRLDNPAFYWTQRNMIVAGIDLARFSAQLAKATAANERVGRQLRADFRALEGRANELAKQLEAHGYSEAQRAEELVATKARWRADLEKLRAQLEAAEARNTQMFNEITARMFARLYHEAFHAYLQNYVYESSDRERAVPRWLDEGLAQLYESGQLEVDTLRIDVPDRERLAALAADLRGPAPLSLAELVSAQERVFLSAHLDGRPTAARHYLYAWGLAYYLVFGPPALGNVGIDLLSEHDSDSGEKLEKILGMPLAEFEAVWRREMLKPVPAAPAATRSPPSSAK
jgi:hypothetical protein